MERSGRIVIVIVIILTGTTAIAAPAVPVLGEEALQLRHQNGVIKIDFGVIFFDLPLSGIGARLSSDSQAASHVRWSGLLSSGFEVMGSASTSSALWSSRRRKQQQQSAVIFPVFAADRSSNKSSILTLKALGNDVGRKMGRVQLSENGPAAIPVVHKNLSPGGFCFWLTGANGGIYDCVDTLRPDC
uniref:Uncharacterized protein n=1 Tax=Anopheles merus TaxID=30066 RepID=A0A182VGX5_ANOME